MPSSPFVPLSFHKGTQKELEFGVLEVLTDPHCCGLGVTFSFSKFTSINLFLCLVVRFLYL